jgi:hypothetical protein
MTKEQYFEMCEMLGTNPIDSEIPIEIDDLPLEVQEAINIYSHLRDDWDYTGGNYIGKSLIGFKDILNMYEVNKSDYKYMYELIIYIDRIRAKQIHDSKPKTT